MTLGFPGGRSLTDSSTVYPATETIGLVTVIVSSPTATITATVTSTVLGMKARRAREAAIRAAITPAPEVQQLGHRQDTGSTSGNGFDPVAFESSLSSACKCNQLFTAHTDYDTCTASTSV